MANNDAVANVRLVRKFFEGFGSPEKDKAAMRALCSPDFLWENSGMPSIKGYEAAASLIDLWSRKIDFAALKIEILSIAGSGDTVLCERVDTFYNSKNETLFELPIVGSLKIRSGKIVAYRDYFDSIEVRKLFSE